MRPSGVAKKMAECVIDASAILAILFDEPGRGAALEFVGSAAISTVTIAEVATRLADDGQEGADIREVINGFAFEVHAFDGNEAFACAALRSPTRAKGLSLGDRACLALAGRLGIPAITADRAWSEIAGAVGVDVHQIR